MGWGGQVAIDADARRQMSEALRHRGPDDEGWFVIPGHVGLGFRRLAIIDLKTGNQPLFNEDRSIAVTCNGEIYNFPLLRRELERRGHSFRTQSDVEVIPHLYEEKGIDCLDALQGMFALALWDASTQRLVLACDRLGVKPLYWMKVGAGVVFASEPVGILASGVTQGVPDPEAIMHYLTLQYVPAPLTSYRGMKKLAPGERLVFENGAIRVDRYWHLPEDQEKLPCADEEIFEELDELLRDATRCRLLADVPLGAFLSGGVDSSLIVSYMAEFETQVKTFSIGVPMAGYTESEHAERIAELFGTEHHEYIVEAEAVPSVADEVRHAGEPFADSSAIPTYLISGAMRRSVTVALSGDGGDEAFGGYERHLRAIQFDRLPRALKSAGRLAASITPESTLMRSSRLRRAATLFRGNDAHERYASMVTHFPPSALEGVCRPEFIEAAGGTGRAWEHVLALPDSDEINRYMRLDVRTYLPGDVLVKVDRMSMAHALEVRSPLLDYRIHEFAARLPGRYKIHGNTTKWLLKQLAVRRGIPTRNVHRPKMGFRVPIGEWLRGPLKRWITEMVLSPEARARGYFIEGEVSKMLKEHIDGIVNHELRLWNLAMLELWHRTWIDRNYGQFAPRGASHCPGKTARM